MIDFWQLILLGAIAGFTIFLGLPVALLQNVSSKKKGFLNALATGILIFLIIDVFSHAWESAEDSASDAFARKAPLNDAAFNLLALFGGLAIGLLGLVWYESRYLNNSSSFQKSKKKNNINDDDKVILSSSPSTFTERSSDNGEHHLHQQLLQVNAYKLAMMIAIGIGAHNFSEGLAIGQSYVTGAIGLAIILIIGFGLHNTTEGFGIAGPLTGLIQRPKIRFLILAGLIGGGPTFIGTIVGSLWVSATASVLFFSIAGGALIYVSLLMYNAGRKQATNAILMTGILVGLCAGFITDLIVTIGGA